MQIRSELLSPAGSFDALRAAVQSGADAVYFGAGDFNARRNAENFGGTLDTAVHYCHIRGAKAFITLNTMVREDEFSRLEKTVEDIAASGADGVIVQDLGAAEFIRSAVPSIELHASTQMAVHNAAGVEFLTKKGFHRVVLAREMTVENIRECAKIGTDLEVFVHGALCVSCSGQCLLSSMIGGRSGNRGLCAQPCRMKYDSDNKNGYLLSTRDLCGLETLPELLNAGVFSFKLEGRLKRPEYVSLTTRIYREAIDAYASGRKFNASAYTAELAQMFNRGGFTDGYFHDVEESALMYPARPNHIGLEIGSCTKDGNAVLNSDVLGTDAIVLRRGENDIPVHPGALPTGNVRMREARRGDRIVRLVSDAQMRSEHRFTESELRRIPVSAACEMHIGEPVKLTLTDGMHTVSASGDIVQTARSGNTDETRLRAQIEKTGDTPFTVSHTQLTFDEAAFVPVSAINAVRRNACAQLEAMREGPAHPVNRISIPRLPEEPKGKSQLIIQSDDPDILCRALKAGADLAAFRPRDLRIEALERFENQLPDHFDLVLPPVMTDQSMRVLNTWALRISDRITRTWISNIGQFDLKWPGILWGDAALNIANNTAAYAVCSMGLEGYTPSIELNCSQIRMLTGRRSLIVYGRMPLMELRHCPYRSTHSLKGKHAACRHCDSARPGDRLDDIRFKDRTGAAFPMKRCAASDGCVIEMMNSASLMLLRKFSSLPHVSSVRLVLESGDPAESLVSLHRSALNGMDVRTLALFDDICSENTTTGHYFRGVQ